MLRTGAHVRLIKSYPGRRILAQLIKYLIQEVKMSAKRIKIFVGDDFKRIEELVGAFLANIKDENVVEIQTSAGYDTRESVGGLV